MGIRFTGWTWEEARKLLGRLLAGGATLAALWCFIGILGALPAQGNGSSLFDPYVTFYDPHTHARLADLAEMVPMVAVWPFVLIISLVEAATHGPLHRPEVMIYLLGMAAALIAANILGYLRQDERNGPALFGVTMWSVSLGLSMFDLATLVAVPGLWKRDEAGNAFGAQLRMVEMVSWIAFLGALAPIYLNRVRPDALQAFAKVMWNIWGGLIVLGAVAALIGPLVADAMTSTFGRINQGHHALGNWLVLALEARVAWLLFAGPIWTRVRLGLGLLFQLLLTRPLVDGASGGGRKTHRMPFGRRPGT